MEGSPHVLGKLSNVAGCLTPGLWRRFTALARASSDAPFCLFPERGIFSRVVSYLSCGYNTSGAAGTRRRCSGSHLTPQNENALILESACSIRIGVRSMSAIWGLFLVAVIVFYALQLSGIPHCYSKSNTEYTRSPVIEKHHSKLSEFRVPSCVTSRTHTQVPAPGSPQRRTPRRPFLSALAHRTHPPPR